MTLQSIPLSAILPPQANPRSAIDPTGIESLAASIQTDGLLQNLVVKPVKGKKPRYRLISGERRYQALKLLDKRGVLAKDYLVPVDIRLDLSDEETLRLATVENLLRENLPPLDEAQAFATLLQHGTPIEEVSAQTGVSTATIKRRLALTNLCEEAQQTLTTGAITLGQAEALTLGSHEAQRELLDHLESGTASYDAEDIREILLERKPTAAMAIFPLEQYTGTFTSDLFAEEQSTYFDDIEQFFALQRQAVEALAERHRGTAEWVEVTTDHRVADWQYDQVDDGEVGGVLINLSPTGRVDVREQLKRYPVDPDTAAETAGTPLAPTPKPAYSEVLCRYIAHHKSMAVQHVLFNNARKAKEVAVLLLMGASDYAASVETTPHACLKELARTEQPPAAYQAIEQHAKRLARLLSLAGDDEERSGWELLRCRHRAATTLYEAVKTLPDEDLNDLHVLLMVLCFGQGNCHRLDTGDSLFNRVARDLDVDMRGYWRPDEAFLSRRNKAQLQQIIEESGLSASIVAGDYKKGELVRKLERTFARVHSGEDRSEHDLKVREWLPDAMRFPAVDPATEGALSDEAPSEAPTDEALAA